jgi:hypothetical protein
MKKIIAYQEELRIEIHSVREHFDIHKKLYKLESAVGALMNRKGSIEPIWGAVVLLAIIFLYFLLKALGVF